MAENMPKIRLVNIAEQSLTALKNSNKKADHDYYEQLTKDYGLTPEKIERYAQAFYEESNKQNQYKNFNDFVAQHFTTPKDKTPTENYINYLVGKQMYGISTVNAGSGMPILNRVLGIYRHGYIQIYDSPFKNGIKKHNQNHEILELNPAGQTDEYAASRVTGQVRIVPGIVTMALHLSAKERLETGEYDLKNYRPWVNDCQTYFKHAQQSMNMLLVKIDDNAGHALSQPIIEHYRYRPEMNKKDAQWVRKQMGLEFEPDKRIFKVSEKGIGVDLESSNHFSISKNFKNLSPHNRKNVNRLKITKDFRNVKIDREMNEDPSRGFSGYAQWIMMQFARSIKDRCKQANMYKDAKQKTRGHIHAAVTQLNKQDTFVHEMTNTLFCDFMQLNMSDKARSDLIHLYDKISTSQQSVLKKSSELLSLLKKMEKEPFNIELAEKIKLKELEVTKELTLLENEVTGLSNQMKKHHVLGKAEIKNLKMAINDIKTYKHDLNHALKDILIKPKADKKQAKQPEKVQFSPLILSDDKRKNNKTRRVGYEDEKHPRAQNKSLKIKKN